MEPNINTDNSVTKAALPILAIIETFLQQGHKVKPSPNNLDGFAILK
jgi:hypothetical protein